MRAALPIPKLKSHHIFLSRQLRSTLWAQTDLSRLSSPQLLPLCSHLLSKGFLTPSSAQVLTTAICAGKIAPLNHFSDRELMAVLSLRKRECHNHNNGLDETVATLTQ